jgi:hypothetical protein
MRPAGKTSLMGGYPMVFYRIGADLVVVFHFSYIAFVVLGMVAIPLDWRSAGDGCGIHDFALLIWLRSQSWPRRRWRRNLPAVHARKRSAPARGGKPHIRARLLVTGPTASPSMKHHRGRLHCLTRSSAWPCSSRSCWPPRVRGNRSAEDPSHHRTKQICQRLRDLPLEPLSKRMPRP